MKNDEGTVSLPIGRHPVDRKKMAVIRDGQHSAKDAVTHYTTLARFHSVSYLSLRLETGRTHQIRVHMAALGHALLGDEVYATTKTRFEKQHPTLFKGQVFVQFFKGRKVVYCFYNAKHCIAIRRRKAYMISRYYVFAFFIIEAQFNGFLAFFDEVKWASVQIHFVDHLLFLEISAS
jgi:hypothetical protein